MNKRTFAKLTLLALVLTMLTAACGPTPAAAPAAPAAPTQAPAAAATQLPAPTAAPTKAPEKPVDIELWYGASVSEAGSPPDDWAAYKIIKEKLGINLKLVTEPSSQADQDTKINAAAAANNLPDVFMVSRDPVLYKLVQQGLVAPVDKLLPLMPERTKTHYNDVDRNKLATWDGVMYGLPDPGTLPHIDGLVIRKDWLDKLNLKAPTTLDEFLAVAKAFTEKDPDGNGKNDTYGFCAYIEGTGLSRAGLGTRFDWVYGAYNVAGVWNLTDSASFGLNVRNPNAMKATQFVKQMVDAKVIDPDWPTLKKDEFRARWKQGKCGMMHENFAALSTKANYADFDKNFPAAQWDVLTPPKGPDGKSTDGVEIAGARIYAISKKAADAGKGPAIAKLLEWMATDGYMLLGFGQEGVNYKLDKDGIVTTEGVDPKLAYTVKEMQPLTQLRNMVYVNNALELKVRYPSFKTASGRIQDPLAYRNGFDKQPYTESTGAAIINPPSNAADFVRFYNENIIKFVLGQQPLNDKTWADFVAGLDKLGAKDLEANAKKQLQQAGFLK
jgi:putative aldouronate transport system substrate-binding protein